ncbi:hypothetical protein E2562_028066 [Oryza meyeriana var. granulata]|uniref:DC1 domain-containing protein n=1 Tax=Oryza meyeriana var. granulata TaxID=110450 RepID=A0A6G1C072_9ORYZ|nr:hypothetical protein E2562_028066 [Oryza meyeriana var. granulata]
MEREIKSHPLHPNCPLVLDSSGKRFVCSACKLTGSDMYVYSCAGSCDFNLHGQCATCPEKLSFWGHPQHELVLQRSRADMGRVLMGLRSDIRAALMSTTPKGGVLPVGCEMCTLEIEGMHYYCAPCGIFVHAVCAMLPKLVRSAAHAEHELALFCSAPTMCAACHVPAVWAYRCMPCLAFYHQNCLPENSGLFAKPFNDRPSNPFFVPPPMMSPHGGGGVMMNEANPFGLVHTYRNRGL